jgi:hypothetical protein
LPNGDKYEGFFQNDKYEGAGTLTYSEGRILSGIWRNGEIVDLGEDFEIKK